MNRQQKNNLLCILTIIFAGLILIGNERTMRQSIGQWEKEEKRTFDSIDRETIDTDKLNVVPFSYSIAFAQADMKLDEYQKFHEKSFLPIGRGTSFEDYFYDPARAREQQHNDNVFLVGTISTAVLIILIFIFLPTLLNWWEGRKRIPGLIITNDEYENFKYQRELIGQKIIDIRTKIDLYEQDRENEAKAAYCLALEPIADGLEQVKKKLDGEFEKIEKWMGMTQEERQEEIMKRIAAGIKSVKASAAKIAEETVKHNLEDSGKTE